MFKKICGSLVVVLGLGLSSVTMAQVCGDGGNIGTDLDGQTLICSNGTSGMYRYGQHPRDGLGPLPADNGGTGNNGGYSGSTRPTRTVIVNKFGAVAWNDKTGGFDTSYGQDTKQQARQQALQKCGVGCKIVNNYSNQCAAIALGTRLNGKVGYRTGGYSKDYQLAEQNALTACNAKANNCKIVLSECSKFDDSSNKM